MLIKYGENNHFQCAKVWLTLSRLASFGDFRKKTTALHVALRGNFSGLVSATDTVKGLEDSAKSCSLQYEKKFFGWGVQIFCEWRHKWRTFRPPWPTSPGPGPKPLDGSISLKFLLETRLQYEYFDTLDDLLGFRIEKLWSKLIKIFDQLGNQIINLFILDNNFWTRNARKLIKGSKDLDSSLVSNKKFSEILWPGGWTLGQVTWAKMTQRPLHLWRHSQKIRNPD